MNELRFKLALTQIRFLLTLKSLRMAICNQHTNAINAWNLSIGCHLLGPLEASVFQIALYNHAQSARIDSTLNYHEEHDAHHNYSLNDIRPDDSLKAAHSGVKYAYNTHQRCDDVHIYTGHCKVSC